MRLCLRDLKKLWGTPFNFHSSLLDLPLGNVCTDTRSLNRGDFFIPLVGQHYDGHNFIDNAFKKGIQGLIISKNWDGYPPKGLLYWVVDDTTKAYQDLALLHRKLFSKPVVAVTGSVGKTTTRELIRSALSSLGEILSTSQNFNNDFGVPGTLLKINSTHQAIVVEMGMRGQGQIERLSRCTQPDVAVITNIGTAHLELLGSRRNIAKAKCEITKSLNPNGVVVIPYGDQLLEDALHDTWGGRILRVGVDIDSSQLNSHSHEDSVGGKIDYHGFLDSINWEITYKELRFKLPLEGLHNARNFMLALAVAHELRVPFRLIRNLKVDLPFGRGDVLKISSLTIFDETYNASPESVIASLDLLQTRPLSRFAVLGKMLELGPSSNEYHRKVVQHAIKLGIDGLIICAEGKVAQEMFDAGRSLAQIVIVPNAEMAFQVLRNWLKPGDSLLIKASRSVALEKLVDLFKEYY